MNPVTLLVLGAIGFIAWTMYKNRPVETTVEKKEASDIDKALDKVINKVAGAASDILEFITDDLWSEDTWSKVAEFFGGEGHNTLHKDSKMYSIIFNITKGKENNMQMYLDKLYSLYRYTDRDPKIFNSIAYQFIWSNIDKLSASTFKAYKQSGAFDPCLKVKMNIMGYEKIIEVPNDKYTLPKNIMENDYRNYYPLRTLQDSDPKYDVALLNNLTKYGSLANDFFQFFHKRKVRVEMSPELSTGFTSTPPFYLNHNGYMPLFVPTPKTTYWGDRDYDQSKIYKEYIDSSNPSMPKWDEVQFKKFVDKWLSIGQTSFQQKTIPWIWNGKPLYTCSKNYYPNPDMYNVIDIYTYYDFKQDTSKKMYENLGQYISNDKNFHVRLHTLVSEHTKTHARLILTRTIDNNNVLAELRTKYEGLQLVKLHDISGEKIEYLEIGFNMIDIPVDELDDASFNEVFKASVFGKHEQIFFGWYAAKATKGKFFAEL